MEELIYFFLESVSEPFHITLLGLETYPEQRYIAPHTLAFFVISFKPIAVEYILHTSIADLLNLGKELSPDFWNFKADDIKDFNHCCTKSHSKK